MTKKTASDFERDTARLARRMSACDMAASAVLAVGAIAIAVALLTGCAQTRQAATTPQTAAQTADKIGPLTAHPITVAAVQVVTCAAVPPATEAGDMAPPVIEMPVGAQPIIPPLTIRMGAVTITVTSSNSQQGSTDQAADQVLETGDTTATPTTETDADAPLTVPLTP